MANVKISTINPLGGYQQPVDANTEGVTAGGFYPQNATSNDATAGLERNAGGDLVLRADDAEAMRFLAGGVGIIIPTLGLGLGAGQLGLSSVGAVFADGSTQTTAAAAIARLTSNYNTTGTGFSTVTGSTVSGLLADTAYIVQGRIRWQSSNTAGGPGFSINGTSIQAGSGAGLIDYTVQYQNFANATAGTLQTRHDTAVDAMAALTTTTAASTAYVAYIDGIVITNSSGGNISLRLRSSSTSYTMTALPGTYLSVRKATT